MIREDSCLVSELQRLLLLASWGPTCETSISARLIIRYLITIIWEKPLSCGLPTSFVTGSKINQSSIQWIVLLE